MDEPTAGGLTDSDAITAAELRLAARNHGMPLEALAYDLTPAGLHYLLVHYDIPVLDAASWRLAVGGAVQRPLQLSLADLQARPQVTVPVTLECAGNGRARLRPRPLSQPWLHEAVGTAAWTGTPLAPLLAEAGVASDAVEVVFTGADRGVEGGVDQAYQRSLTVEQARSGELLLAYAMNGQPLLPQHGFPLRLIVPGWYGMASVKWLVDVAVTTEPFAGYQQARAYRFRADRDELGEPVQRIAVRSLLRPPGVPDFFTRRRVVDLADAPVQLVGRAWSGHGPITLVEVSDDGGARWQPADVHPAAGPRAWHRWTATWTPAGPGEYELACRATDAVGHVQPLEPAWNLGGYAVNDVHRVPVTVRGPAAVIDD